MSLKSYPAPWGSKVRLITGSLVFLLVATCVIVPLVVPVKDPEARWVRWMVPLVTGLTLGITSLWMIRRYDLTDHEIRVQRSLWTNRIPLRSIESAEPDPEACRGAWKTIGNDGLFAMHGRFRSRRLGRFQAYVTNPENAVVLRVPGDIIVLSPDNPRAFVKELQRRQRRQEET